MSAGRIAARRDGALGWVVFDNPERRNAVSLEMWEAIPRVLDDFAADAAIRVVVLSGAGDKAFVSGADISQFEKERASAPAVRPKRSSTTRRSPSRRRLRSRTATSR